GVFSYDLFALGPPTGLLVFFGIGVASFALSFRCRLSASCICSSSLRFSCSVVVASFWCFQFVSIASPLHAYLRGTYRNRAWISRGIRVPSEPECLPLFGTALHPPAQSTPGLLNRVPDEIRK